jgi:hypothetical protein
VNGNKNKNEARRGGQGHEKNEERNLKKKDWKKEKNKT